MTVAVTEEVSVALVVPSAIVIARAGSIDPWSVRKVTGMSGNGTPLPFGTLTVIVAWPARSPEPGVAPAVRKEGSVGDRGRGGEGCTDVGPSWQLANSRHATKNPARRTADEYRPHP